MQSALRSGVSRSDVTDTFLKYICLHPSAVPGELACSPRPPLCLHNHKSGQSGLMSRGGLPSKPVSVACSAPTVVQELAPCSRFPLTHRTSEVRPVALPLASGCRICLRMWSVPFWTSVFGSGFR